MLKDEVIGLTDFLKNFSEYSFHKINNLFLVLVALISFILLLDQLLSPILSLLIRYIFYSLLILGVVFYWLHNKYYLPRTKKKVGIVISVFTENEVERNQFKADFISSLKKGFLIEGILKFSELLFLKNHFSEKIINSNDPISLLNQMNKKINANIYIWGDIKKRKEGNEGEKYFLNFQGYVFHKPISLLQSSKLAIEFSNSLPYEINFLENRSFKGFKFSAELINFAIKYILGIASFVSMEIDLAIKFHEGLLKELIKFKELPSNLETVKENIPEFLADEYYWISKLNYSKENVYIAKTYLKKAMSEKPHHYGSWLLKGIIDFQVDKNVNEAFKSIENAEKYSKRNCEWIYSKTFLYFWTRNYSKALTLCEKIKHQNFPFEEKTIKEVRQFNLFLLSTEKSQYQLYFWIGYLSYFKSNNLGDALCDFENFELHADESMSVLKQKSSAYLLEIKKVIGIN